MIELRPVRQEDRDFSWNINQKYLYEMTNYYDDEMDADGNYHYGYFEAYFTDPKRKAFLLCREGRTVGFAMINPYSFFGQSPDHVMAEFTVFPAFRRRHVASEAAGAIFARYPGQWEIKYNEKNNAAKALWTKVTAKYRPGITRLNDAETVLTFTVD